MCVSVLFIPYRRDGCMNAWLGELVQHKEGSQADNVGHMRCQCIAFATEEKAAAKCMTG